MASAYQVLFTPLRIRIPFENLLVVHIYVSGEKDLKGLNWKEIERSFEEEAVNGGMFLEDQKLSFIRYSVLIMRSAQLVHFPYQDLQNLILQCSWLIIILK